MTSQEDSSFVADESTSSNPPVTSGWQEVAEELMRRHRFVVSCARRSREDAMLALGMALKTGDLLRSVKEKVPHGEWTPWLREYLPEMSHSTINRYMRVARLFREMGGQHFGSTLIEAYRGSGILPAKRHLAEAKVPRSTSERSPVDSMKRRISSLRRMLGLGKSGGTESVFDLECLEMIREDLKRLRDEIDGLLAKGKGEETDS